MEPGSSRAARSVVAATKSKAMDYKERFIALINEMVRDNNTGLIPMVIGEGLRESDAYSDERPNIGYWVMQNINQHC